MNHTLLKLLVTLLPIFGIVIVIDAFYSAVIVGNQLAYAGIASAGFTVIAYLIPIIVLTAVIVAIWRKK